MSLIGIVIMIGRKLEVVENGQMPDNGYKHPFVGDMQNIKEIITVNTKKYGHLTVVTILRFYIRGTNLLKNSYEKIKIKIDNIGKDKHADGEKKEISKFLKIIGDYKHKIREIKHKIKEEENL
ncbi:MAG: hypothetical protein UT98_C0003G0046 [Candidatus Nomurabacteria bacterium GW2011_GWF2_40_31]|uniref:Uncharacterized protein n=2 Tax=Candidatus Nomuraibacteriota TaxID=1752729 RepID=A0A837HUE6_9BACT|nr:MAG: hypothetical protein UT27_C0008G0048 [Candidatus Nomurabacteria bacterium GW2011_GWD2_39_12]KKR20542.1 MAG: hypothetical protein UT51_C0003G0046 [Candidatus Nomurabacteria bacterium GW2011_GWC2_39_41]KKR38432.1 MAG: hypothetical protein UT73_C0003G0072 [Candidatus Nomurabacteria bacterium GW2011_GWB1_40_11]KKR59137.1 MAG: hypothetical protein UT98_C0003G0046 [Candidatus Nomurabacteria bacterium GW2011_GWF2_40_31]KKR84331.1 MAG: hypothetical protein UU30_C0002G0027 [Candidatus Nomurabact